MKLKTFDDLEFVSDDLLNSDGSYSFFTKRARLTFDNGWIVSVVIGSFTYGGKDGKYELAILDEDGNICYDSGLGDDVFGFLSEEEVTNLMVKIQELKPTTRVDRDNKLKNILDDTSS
jgi:hypothetical protein